MDLEEKVITDRAALRMVRKIFAGLALLLVALYATAWLRSLRPEWLLSMYLPSLERLPGFARRDTPSNVKLSEEQVAVLNHLDSVESKLAEEEVPTVKAADTLVPPVVPKIPDGIPCVGLEYDTTRSTPLKNFYEQLYTGKAARKQVRILHFGDSQIEGDRITSYLRSRLQKEFGGGGIGLVSVAPSMHSFGGVSLSSSKGWEVRSLMPATARKRGERYGIVGNVCRFLEKGAVDSLGNVFEGSLSIKKDLRAGRGARFTHCRIFARNDSGAFRVTMFRGEAPIAEVRGGSSPVVRDIAFSLEDGLEQFRLQFISQNPVSVYGISLETPTGVQVDNIPLRGSSGTDFTAMDSTTLIEMASYLEPSLLLLQFGVNVVPGKVEGYGFYAAGLIKQINYLKRIFPGVPMILVGVSDMGEKDGEFFRSYGNIPDVQRAQKRAARQTGIAYWDCRRAMGGENSIVAWVQADPPLATADYVHFTPRGARYVGEMLYASLMSDYTAFVQGRK